MTRGRRFYLFIGTIIGILLGLLIGLLVGIYILGGNSVFSKLKLAKQEQPVTTTTSWNEQTCQEYMKIFCEKCCKDILLVGKPLLMEKKVTFCPEFQKGMNFVAWTPDGYKNTNAVRSIDQLATLGVEWVGVVPTWYQEKVDSKEIFPLKDKTSSDESLVYAIRTLHDKKFKVMLKPHLDILKGEGKWRGDIGYALQEDWQVWFDNYTAFILHYAELAKQEKVELFCIGTELTNVAISQPAFWKELIKKVREVYKGPLTYAANWSEEFDAIEFWDELDYAGIDPYFPLVTSLRPTVEQLKGAWEDWLKKIEPWQKKIDKPVIITEIGYKSSVGANEEPWQHSPIGGVDLELQVNCYEALLETFWDKPWFYGVYWWYWGVHPNMGGNTDRGFTPQNKPAQEVVREWYKKTISREACE